MMKVAADATCEDDFDPGSLSPQAALERIAQAVPRITAAEQVALRGALGRVLAADVSSPVNVPAHVNSAMDGYAVRARDLPAQGTASLTVIGEAFAGKPYRGAVGERQAVRIMTGAVVPDGADTVLMQEQVERHGSSIMVRTGHKSGQNVRHAGEDIHAGAAVLRSGRVLTPADLGLAASLGISALPCVRTLRAAIVSTGDELKSLGQPLGLGEIYDSNRYTLYGMLSRMNVAVIDKGVVPDVPDRIRATLLEASREADVIITSGGVSVGEADYVKPILDEIGRIAFWKVAMKPGRPLAFGRIGEAVFFGLPGNPVSVMVTFYLFVRPALLAMLGCAVAPPLAVRAKCLSRLHKKPGRQEFQRGILGRDGDGGLTVTKTGDQGSGILSSMSQADCFIVLPIECGNVEPGVTVDVQPFAGLI
jgi:molybdopterin molybdotransferase